MIRKIKSNSKVSSKSNARGLKPTDLSQEKNFTSSYSWLWQKYSFKYVPSPNSLRSFQFLNKYKTSSNEKFPGIGVSKIPRIGFDAMEEEKLLL